MSNLVPSNSFGIARYERKELQRLRVAENVAIERLDILEHVTQRAMVSLGNVGLTEASIASQLPHLAYDLAAIRREFVIEATVAVRRSLR